MAAPFVLWSQSSVKHLRLISSNSHIPVQNASVYNEAAGFGEVSDELGIVSLKRLPNTVTSLTISAIGFESIVIDMKSLKGANGEAVLMLTPRISTLSDVVVKASSKTGIFKTMSDLDIHIRPIMNSQEVLRLVPGLFIGQHAGGGKAEQIFLRGFDLDHGTDINITVDGMPVNMVSHAHGQGYADLHFLIPELIDKVNFNKGPYETSKGNLATAGYVAFKTKNVLDQNFVKLEGGQYSTFRGITGINLLGNKNPEQTLLFASEFSFTKGYFESPQNFSRINSLLKYHSRTGKNSYLTATASAFSSKWNASGQIPDRAVANGTIGFFGAIDNNEGGLTGRYNANLEFLHYLNNGAIFRNQFYFTDYRFELYSNFTFFKEDPVNGDQIRQKEHRKIMGFTNSYEQQHQLFNHTTQFTAGVQLRYDYIDKIELSRTKSRTITTAPLALGNIHELNVAAFAEEKLQFSTKLDLTFGFRVDYFSNRYQDLLNGGTLHSQSPVFSPKLNFNYKVNKNIQLYWYNGQGFHSNDTRVAVVQNGRDVVTPAWGSDLGGIFKLNKKIIVQSAIWYLWMKQEFVYVGDEGVVEPGGKTQRMGFDLSVRYELLKHFFLDADLSIANPKAIGEPKGSDYLPLAPRVTSTGGLSYRVQKGWNGSLRYRYMGNRPANEDNTVIAKGYFVTDMAINYTQPKWEAGVAIQNLFNTKWKETQFDTESRLQNEPAPVSEIHFTPGSPFFGRLSFTFFF